MVFSRVALSIALLGFTGFILFRPMLPIEQQAPAGEQRVDRIVIGAPVLLLLNGGDRFLAANLETMRLSAMGLDSGAADMHYLMRAQRVVSELNACQEHNYYLANALLTWGGAVDEGEQVLHRAVDCRFWDEWPAFFYGFNRAFFQRDVEGARIFLELAAQRATSNAAGFRKLAIMLSAEQIEDEKLALEYLRQEYEKATDQKLKQMLALRVARLEGLVRLRDLQRLYERRFGEPLKGPEQLVTSGLTEALPVDPMRHGYEFVGGRFVLKKIRVAGVEVGQ